MMEEKELKALMARYQAGNATPADLAFLESWYLKYHSGSPFMMEDKERIQDVDKVWETLKQDLPVRKTKLWIKLVAAASLALAILGGGIFYSHYLRSPQTSPHFSQVKNDVKPGGNKAYLTLASGQKIALNDVQDGKLAKEAGVEITKTASGQLVYHVNNSNAGVDDQNYQSISKAVNTIETPRGGQYQVRLPDGTKVWLNAASKLTYAVAFTASGKRQVTLSGEAYFEVTTIMFQPKVGTILTSEGTAPLPPRKMPFIVKTNGQEVEVLGTHFNINAYADEPGTKTTLLEGSVQVTAINPSSTSAPAIVNPASSAPGIGSPTSSAPGIGNSATSPPYLKEGWSKTGVVILKPNQQATLLSNKIKTTQVDAENAILWKKGKFSFNSEELGSIMRKVSRWYNVEVNYKDNIQNIKISGSVSRFANLSTLLNKLEQTGMVHFEIEENKIAVSK